MRVRALLFDFDGVIVDTEVPTYESWREIYAEHGVDLALGDWLPVVGTGTSTEAGAVFDAVAHLERLLGTTLDREEVVERRRRRKAELCDAAVLLPGVAGYLATARELGLRTGIVTRASSDWVRHHLGRVGLDHCWDAIVCADGAHGVAKAVFYREGVAKLGVAPREGLAFEDSAHGALAAREAGLRCVAVPNSVTRGADFDDADLVLSSLAERPLEVVLAELGA